MDKAELRQKVIDTIKARLAQPNVEDKAFTSVDISHPIIEEDIAKHGQRTVFHRQVNEVIRELFAAGELIYDDDVIDGGIPVVRTAITVYPKPGQTATAFLYHPDDPAYDPNSYNERNQELVTDATAAATQATSPARTRNFDMDDEEDDDPKADKDASVITTTVSGQPVTKQCQIQRKQDTLNIPRVLVKAAGWSTGDAVSVNAVGPTIFVRREVPGHQRVDAEGRIRIHGKNVDSLNKTLGDTCTALLVTPKNGDASYIQVQ